MCCFLVIMRTVIVGIVLVGSIIKSVAQNPASTNSPQSEVILTKLTQPVYPPLARQVRISGNVELMLEMGRDGSIQSANVVSGHALLVQAALDSAQRSQFECRNCAEGKFSYDMVYSFRLTEADSNCCTTTQTNSNVQKQGQRLPSVVQSGNRITVVDQAPCVCGPGPNFSCNIRSLKCLYLWKCSHPRLCVYQ